jgi:ABC-type multidrug transport system fused ATPase/permease subunit
VRDDEARAALHQAVHSRLDALLGAGVNARCRLIEDQDADLILVMREGDIVEQGTHDELIEAGGFYADLYNSQFEDVTA